MLSVDTWIKLNSQVSGKDKIARLLQYFAKFLAHRIQMLQRAKETLRKLQILETFLSNYRKVLRLGKSFELLYSALSTLRINDRFLRVMTTLSRCNSAIYLLLDNIMCIQRAGFIDFDISRIKDSANKFWLCSTLCNLFRDMYEICVILSSDVRHGSCGADLPVGATNVVSSTLYRSLPVSRPLITFAHNHKPVFIDTLKNLCDVFLPLSSLGKVNLRSDVVGLLGFVSSYLAILAIIDPTAKLPYS